MSHDRITLARTLRLVVHLPLTEDQRAHYSVIATYTRRGIPDARILAAGTLTDVEPLPDAWACLELLEAALRDVATRR